MAGERVIALEAQHSTNRPTDPPQWHIEDSLWTGAVLVRTFACRHSHVFLAGRKGAMVF